MVRTWSHTPLLFCTQEVKAIGFFFLILEVGMVVSGLHHSCVSIKITRAVVAMRPKGPCAVW